jgi:hypothetical protein
MGVRATEPCSVSRPRTAGTRKVERHHIVHSPHLRRWLAVTKSTGMHCRSLNRERERFAGGNVQHKSCRAGVSSVLVCRAELALCWRVEASQNHKTRCRCAPLVDSVQHVFSQTCHGAIAACCAALYRWRHGSSWWAIQTHSPTKCMHALHGPTVPKRPDTGGAPLL